MKNPIYLQSKFISMKYDRVLNIVFIVIGLIGLWVGIDLYPSKIGEEIFTNSSYFLLIVIMYIIIEKLVIYMLVKYNKKNKKI